MEKSFACLSHLSTEKVNQIKAYRVVLGSRKRSALVKIESESMDVCLPQRCDLFTNRIKNQ